MAGSNKQATGKGGRTGGSPLRFESARLELLFLALDAVAWLDGPNTGDVAQFAGIDPRTAGKLLKNACQIGLIEKLGNGFLPAQAYPFDGTIDQKKAVVREALVRFPLLTSMRQFLLLGDKADAALRKAATVSGVKPFVASDLNPLIVWANSLNALRPNLVAEDLVEEAVAQKEIRHQEHSDRRVAFLSHSSADKPFIRQLAADLTANGIDVWLDEQRIRVGDSIPEKIAQGLAESDFFLIGLSENSTKSEWVKKELNNALVREVRKRKVHVLPLLIDKTDIPEIISDKKYADFSESYKEGLADLLASLKGDLDG